MAGNYIHILFYNFPNFFLVGICNPIYFAVLKSSIVSVFSRSCVDVFYNVSFNRIDIELLFSIPNRVSIYTHTSIREFPDKFFNNIFFNIEH